MSRVKTVLLILVFLVAPRVWAYPTYISYGYHSCISCHYNPMGNGPLTDYGKSVAATELTDRALWPSSVRNDDERLADMTGFFFDKPALDWLRPSMSYRGLYLQQNPGAPTQKSQWVNMDASAALALKFFPDDRLIFVGQVGYAPTPLESQGDGKSYSNYRSREYYVGYRVTKSFGLYAGLMDKAFGIRVPDHEAFSRTATHLDEDDQTDGVLAQVLTENWEFALQPFVGNLVQEPNLRQKGAAAQIGYMVGDTTRLGASFAKSNSDVLAMTMYSLDVRTGFGAGNSMLFEVGQVKSAPQGQGSKTDRYVFIQNQWLVHRGLSPLLTLEMLQPDISQNGEIYRFGPGIQYFPIYRMELRADVYDVRERSAAAYANDTWMITGQVHLWF